MKKIFLLICLTLFTLNFAQITEGNIVTQPIDTHAFVPYTTAPDIDGSNKGSFFNDAKLTEFKPVQVSQYKKAEKFDANSYLNTPPPDRNARLNEIAAEAFPDKDKLDLTTTVDIRDTHEVSSNGKIWVPKENSTEVSAEILMPHQNSNEENSSNGIISTIFSIIITLVIFIFSVLLVFISRKRKYY